MTLERIKKSLFLAATAGISTMAAPAFAQVAIGTGANGAAAKPQLVTVRWQPVQPAPPLAILQWQLTKMPPLLATWRCQRASIQPPLAVSLSLQVVVRKPLVGSQVQRATFHWRPGIRPMRQVFRLQPLVKIPMRRAQTQPQLVLQRIQAAFRALQVVTPPLPVLCDWGWCKH
jgi:hypothetical protein